MHKVTPYRTRRGLERALDNGGRWYDLFSRAGDGRVSESELSRAASGRDPGLFLALAGALLSDADRSRIIDVLPEATAERVRLFRPTRASPARVAGARDVGGRYVVEGRLHAVTDPEILLRNVVFRITDGTDRSSYPLGDPYKVFQVRADEADDGPFVLFARGRRAPPTVPMRLGGILRRLVYDHDQLMWFLEPHFYTPLDDVGAGEVDDDADVSREGLRDSLRHRVR